MSGDLPQLWLQFGQLAAGVLILATGIIQIAFARPFGRHRNTALAALGLGGVLYGVRLLSAQDDVRALLPASDLFWRYLDTDLTYLLLVPILYFLELTVGSGWRNSIRWLRLTATVYAVAAILIDAVMKVPQAAKGPNGYIVVVTIALIVVNTLRIRTAEFPGLRVVRAGILIMGAFVLFENVVNDRFLHGDWNVEWIGVLSLLGCLGYVAMTRAIETDRHLHDLKHELETARQIQVSILPRHMPVVDGLALGARYLPMTAVAGDFYDFLELGAGRVGILVADVSGHGVPAALIASMVKVAFVAQSAHADHPGRVLAGMNAIFCGRLERQFITAAYVYIDVPGGSLRYGAAGHPPALLVNKDAGVDELTENGVMLGHFPEWPYSFIARPFRSGDRLILYTDGVIEATNRMGEFFDPARLRGFASHQSAGPADAFAGALVRHVTEWSGRTSAQGFDDDVTVVVVDRLP
jgi:sigma-B regulation protein RsbU (phosphoserine phosphatase)